MASVIQRRRSLKRKETARRNLMDSIYTKQGEVRYVTSCLPLEHLRPDIKFPRLNSKEMCMRVGTQSKTCSYSDSKHSHQITTTSPHSYIEILDESGYNDSITRNSSKKIARKSSSQNISLPEIIMEFNLETSMAVMQSGTRATSPSSSAECYDEERAIGAPYELFLKNNRYNRLNPCQSRYRPVTPGLLESLNKRKLPSKVKTEQWVRSSQKSLQGHVYKTENIDSTTNWIYDN